MANDDLSTCEGNKPIDESLLIDLVKEHPVIWDLTEDKYRKKVSCDPAWETICRRLFPGFECYEDDHKTSLRKDVKKKWTTLRDCYNKSRKAGKESISKYKSLDFLSKVYEVKNMRFSLFVPPSKEKTGTPAVDPDADTQINSTLPKSCRGGQTNTRTTRDRAASTDSSEPVGPADGINERNVMMEECESPRDDPEDESLDEDIKDVQPHSSTSCTGGESASAQNTTRRGVKRPSEESNMDDGDQHLIQFIKKSLTKNFNQSQNKKFRSEMLQLLESACDDFDDTEIEDLNIKILQLLLSSMTNLKLQKKCEMIKQIICCVGAAQNSH